MMALNARRRSSLVLIAFLLPHVLNISLAGAATQSASLSLRLEDRTHPHLACTSEELQRLRHAYRGQGREHEVVARYVREAEPFVDEAIVFPPRGGQHNQWYQCDECETALKTIDATHHRCPECRKVYTGHPYDDVVFSRQHGRNLGRMETAAWAHAISGREQFAEYAARVLLGYAQRYRQYPYHSASLETASGWGRKSGGHLYEQTLTEASAFATRIGPAYDLIHDSGVLSHKQHEQIRNGLLLPMLENIGRNEAGKSNWQTWHNAAMLWGGALIEDPAWIERAIADDDNGFYHQMQVSVSREGMWYENSWGYHFYTLKALVIMAETGRRLGIDLWGHERFAKMFTLPVYYTMSDGSLPRFGDDVNSSVRRARHLFEPAYQAYKDRRMLAVLRETPSFQTVLLGRSVKTEASLPPLESVVFGDAGHAILRGDGPAKLTAAMTFGPYGGFHGHYDKLSFVFFGFGRELGVDPGRARSQAYRLPIHRHWYKATLGHNAVLVDGQSQKPATGKLERFEQGDGYAAVVASCDQAYAGVNHRRLLLLTGEYLLVVDDLQADRDRRFDWLYHNRGRRLACDIARDDADLANAFPGSEYIRQARRGATDDEVRVSFIDDEVNTHLTVAAQNATTLTIGSGVGASVTDRVPMVMLARTGRAVQFAAVLEPVQRSGKARVAEVGLARRNATLTVAVERREGTDRVTLGADNELTMRLVHSSSP
jgi:hypothetical protein